MNDIKTILLIGRTGNGKSTLANIITGTSDFTEGPYATSKTKKIQIEEFEDNEINYRIIDTVGIGDTKMTVDKVLRKIALMGYSVKDGLSQIIFVTDGKLAQEAKSTYYLLKEVIFDKDIANCTTVIRTKFTGFRNKKICEKEEEKMCESSGEFKWLIEQCNKIIFVDNQPIDIIDDEDLVFKNKQRRNESRKIILNHLREISQKQHDDYKPNNLSGLSNLIDNYMIEKLSLEKKEKRGILPLLNKKRKNGILNKEITEKMIEHIGNIDPNLKEKIKGELKKLENERKSKKESSNPLNWGLFFATTEVPSKS